MMRAGAPTSSAQVLFRRTSAHSTRLPACSSGGNPLLSDSFRRLSRRGAALRVIADPNEVEVDSTSRDENSLEKELACQLALRAAQGTLLSSDVASVSARPVVLELPPYNKVQLRMPGITASGGVGLHIHIDPQEAVASSSSSVEELRTSLDAALREPPTTHSEPASTSQQTPVAAVPILTEQKQIAERLHTSSSAGTRSAAVSEPMSAPATDQQQTVATPGPKTASAVEIPKSIMIISLVSASLTLASCVFNTLLPIYMVVELKMTMRSMGVFEGLLEAFSYMIRMFSGVASDMMTSRKSAITLGFAMGAMAKFGMSGATEVGTLFASKAVDRLANGVQAAPRDALISDLAPDSSRSACFGYAQSLRKWGSAVGAVMVYFLMKASGNNYQLIFTMAASVSLASCVAFVLLVPSHARTQRPDMPAANAQSKTSQSPLAAVGARAAQLWKDVVGMGPDFYRMLSIIFLLGMGHINESLLEARAIEVGFGKAESTLVVATLSFVIFVVAYPLGRLDDKFGPRVTFAVSMAALIIADLILMASGAHPWAVFISLLFMGVHMGVMQGPLLSIVVGLAPGHLRGTAFGIFYTVMAVTALTANSMFGTVWYSHGATTAFGLSAALTTATLTLLPWLLPNRPLVPAAA